MSAVVEPDTHLYPLCRYQVAHHSAILLLSVFIPWFSIADSKLKTWLNNSLFYKYCVPKRPKLQCKEFQRFDKTDSCLFQITQRLITVRFITNSTHSDKKPPYFLLDCTNLTRTPEGHPRVLLKRFCSDKDFVEKLVTITLGVTSHV